MGRDAVVARLPRVPLTELLIEAWRLRAPARLRAAFDAAPGAQPRR